jgi:hypothetical protein
VDHLVCWISQFVDAFYVSASTHTGIRHNDAGVLRVRVENHGGQECDRMLNI